MSWSQVDPGRAEAETESDVTYHKTRLPNVVRQLACNREISGQSQAIRRAEIQRFRKKQRQCDWHVGMKCSFASYHAPVSLRIE